jgi:hypothetical protein
VFNETCGGTNLAAVFEDCLDFCRLGARPAFSLLGAACDIESVAGIACIDCAVGNKDTLEPLTCGRGFVGGADLRMLISASLFGFKFGRGSLLAGGIEE